MIKILINGSEGKMGRAVASLINQNDDLSLAGGVDAVDQLNKIISACDVIIDFSSPMALKNLLKNALEAKKPLVIGTTGYSDEEKELIAKAAKNIPIVYSPNMSIGVNLLWKLCDIAARTLKGFEFKVVERHHAQKKDSPSGTAKKIVEVLSNAVDMKAGEIQVEAIREGDVVGEHFVKFIGKDEVVEISHIAKNRNIFARGAVKAASWIVGKKPGLYNMIDVLF